MKWKWSFLFFSLIIFVACKSIKQDQEEVQYWIIELTKGVTKTHLIDNYSHFNIDNPRPNNRTLNQYIGGFMISEEREKDLIAQFKIDEKIAKFSKSNVNSDAIQSSTNSAKAKVSPIKNIKN